MEITEKSNNFLIVLFKYINIYIYTHICAYDYANDMNNFHFRGFAYVALKNFFVIFLPQIYFVRTCFRACAHHIVPNTKRYRYYDETGPFRVHEIVKMLIIISNNAISQ